MGDPGFSLGLGTVLLAIGIVLVGGAIKGAIAFGFPLFTTPLMAALLGPRTAVVVIVLPVLVANLVVLVRRPAQPGTLRRFLPIMLTMAPATLVGSMLLSRVDGRPLAILVGSLALGFAALSALRVRLLVPARHERWVGPAIGLAGGVVHGASGISGPLIAAYADALHLDPRGFTYGVTLLFTVGGLVQGLTYAQLGLFNGATIVASLLLVPIGLVGQQAGFRLQVRLDPRRFRNIVVGVVALSSVSLLLRGLSVT